MTHNLKIQMQTFVRYVNSADSAIGQSIISSDAVFG
ncbi:hypothetical protein SAMN06295879_2178 [Agreia bicolorata]|uniref:Uncharacterized protein n=1 Tax=Agreia bicolorata TaxID=110935 RepID=A0A1T4Y3Z1_9MICO|nr:hypothetical protein SAMN06295879_2178 [Agreia bicolorata]